MKKLIAVLILLAAAFALFARNRIYVRDPFGSVAHNGAREAGAQVYINYPSEVLIENDSPLYVLLVQQNNHVGIPQSLHCLHYLVCLTDADQATLTSGGWSITVDDMSTRAVHYHDKHSSTVVTIF